MPEPEINQQGVISVDRARAAQPRAMGVASLAVRADATGATRLSDLRQAGSSRLVFPRVPANRIDTILVNTAGGITGGDRFALDAGVGPGATLSLTTQAAERAYRAQPGEVGRAMTTLRVADGATLHWLPQELILFERCALHRDLSVELDGDARLLMVEPVVFGRAAMAERLSGIRFRDRVRITRNGRLLYRDGVDLRGDAATHLARRAVANGAGAMAALVLVRPDAAAQIAPLRDMLPATAGATLLAEDVLVIRHLAPDAFALRRDMLPILDRLTDRTLPPSWRL